ncbi:MAG: hypothetical protein JRH01_18425 [Deltaproteobacteria bacterium]|nr:hypothetical protein [Deltaproteobacteria bacterium]MBW2395954.1 hypothetical protein [Deltaproteobacteria bacterium]
MTLRVALVCVLVALLGATKPEVPNLGKGQPLPEAKVPRPNTERRSHDNDRRPKTQPRSSNPQKRVRKPHIEQIVPFSSCSPGGALAFVGKSFGPNPGQVHLMGKFLFGKLGLDILEWTDSGTVGVRVPDIGGVQDQQVKIRLTAAGGETSNLVPCGFTAKRERKWLPFDSTHMRLSQCNVGQSYSQGNAFNDPDKTYGQESGSLLICYHKSDGDNWGADKYETKTLKNGWRFVEWKFTNASGQGGQVLMRTGFVPDASQLNLRVNWNIDGGGIAHYSFKLGIEGPRGLPFQ